MDIERKQWLDEFKKVGISQFSSKGKDETEIVNRVRLLDRFDKEDISDWLLDPEKHSKKIRDLSRFLYVSNSDYYRPINYYSNLLTLDYILVPRFSGAINESDVDAVIKSRNKVNNFCDDVLNKPTLRSIIKATLKDGAYFGYIRQNGKDHYLQRLPNDYCRDGYIVNGLPAISFDFEYFSNDEERLLNFDKEFEQKFKLYRDGKEERWQVLEVENTICIPMESEDFNFPAFSNNIQNILDLEDYYKYNKESIESELSKILFQKAPMDEKTGEILVEPDELMYFQNVISEILEKRYKIISTPFDVSAINFTQGKGNDAGYTGVDTAENRVKIGSGVSDVIDGKTDSATGLKINHNANIQFVFSIVEKIEVWANKKLQSISSKKYAFKIKFLPTTLSNGKELFEMFNKLLAIGGSLDVVISSAGINPDDYYDILRMEKLLGVKDLLDIPESIYTQSGTDNDENTGRPVSDEVTDAGEQTRDADGNDR